MKILRPAFAASILLMALGSVASAEETFPSRLVTMISPFSAGGPADAYARVLAEAMGHNLGQPVIVENISGAGGTIGNRKVVVATPDGYTILLNGPSLAIASGFYKELPYDPLRDLVAIGLINEGPELVIARKDLPVKNIAELAKWMKEPGRQVKIAHAGLGSFTHLCGVLLSDAMQIDADQIPYRGNAPALTDLLSGRVDLTCTTIVAANLVRSGDVKAIGVSSKERASQLPEVESFAEAGFPGMEFLSWQGLFAPKGTPPAVIARLNVALKEALKDPKVISTFDQIGVAPYPVEQQVPSAADDVLKSEVKRWGDLIRLHKISADQ